MNPLAVAYLRDAIVQTIGIACASFVLAMLAGLPLALLAARGTLAGRITRGAIAVVRAVPDLVLAIVAVVAIGLGSIAAVVALAIHYAAVIAKLTADLLHTVRRDAAEHLRAGGATASAAFLIGLVPAAWPALVGFAAYAFESIVRASVIVGVVGAGGLGALLVQQLNLADYRGVAVSVTALALLVIAVDAGAERLRRHGAARTLGLTFGALAAGGIIALVAGDDSSLRIIRNAPAHLAGFVAGSLPPDLAPDVVRVALWGAAISLFVALAGTLGGVLCAIPLALLVATPLARGWMRGTGWRPWSLVPEGAGRISLAASRAIPPIALGLVGVTFVGLGPRAGVFALAIHTAGVLGKLLAESLEIGERAPAETLVASGATATAATLVALVPSSLGALVTHVLYRFEWNVRASTVLGMIGAGGLGSAIFESQQLLFYRRLTTDVAVAVLLVLAIDAVATRLRSRLRLATMAL